MTADAERRPPQGASPAGRPRGRHVDDRPWRERPYRWDGAGAGTTVVALAAVLVGSLMLAIDASARADALRLERDGVAGSAHHVVMDVRSSRGGPSIATLRATFTPAGGEEVEADLQHPRARGCPCTRGWGEPGPTSPYAAPLAVLYLPDDPTFAMAAVDVADRSVDRTPRDLAVIAGGLAVGGAGAMLLRYARASAQRRARERSDGAAA